MKTSIGSWAYTIGPYADKPVDFDTVCEKLSKLGFDGVELGGFNPHPNPDDLKTKLERAKIIEKLNDCGLKFSGLAANLWGEKLINTSDQSQYIAVFKENCDFATDLNIETIRVDTVQPPTIFADVDYATAKKRVVETWKLCAKIAADKGLKVTWEVEPGFAFNKPSEILEILEAIQASNFGLLYDTCHAQMIGVNGARQNGKKQVFPNQLEFLKLVGERINHVHLIDSDNTLHKDSDGNEETSSHIPFGQGGLDFDKIIPAILKYYDFNNWWTVDLCFWPNAWEATENCAEFMKNANKKYA